MIKKIKNKIPQLNFWPRINFEGATYLDKTLGMHLEISFLKGVVKILTLSIVVLLASTVYFQNKASKNLDHQRIVMVPGINRKVVIEADSYISETYIKAVSNEVVSLNEQWSFEDYEHNIDDLCRDYYMREQCELLRANIRSTNRIEFVRQNKMFSRFYIDVDKSEYHFCTLLKRPCSLVVGKRSLFFNNNDKVSEKEVAYLIIGANVWPDDNNPFALRVSRLKINEDDDPKAKLLPQLELAIKGDKSVLQ